MKKIIKQNQLRINNRFSAIKDKFPKCLTKTVSSKGDYATISFKNALEIF